MKIFTLAMVALVPSLACAQLAPREDLYRFWKKVGVEKLPKIVPDGRLEDFRLALQRQKENCEEYRTGKFTKCLGESAHVTLACDEATIDRMIAIAARSDRWSDFYKEAKSTFEWYQYQGTTGGDTLFTGYNAPTFEGALRPDTKFKYPLYARPADLVDIKNPDGTVSWKKRRVDGTLGDYDNRRAIDVDHVLAGKGLEIAWMEDPVDIWRLQLEGAGMLRIRNADGSVAEMGANYAGKNGLPLKSPIQYLKDKGVDSKYLSFSGLKRYVRDFPAELWPTLTSNPSYVFFSMNGEPPCATARTYLTQGHTLAVDPTHMPLGTLTLLQSERPADGTDPEAQSPAQQKFARFAIAQDTGGPIQGAHVDIFFGFDDYARLASDTMSAKGTIFMPRLQ